MATSAGVPQTKIPWHLLQAWVSEQQAYETRTSRPAPVTAQQEKALLSILRSIESTKEAPSVDHLTESNWIGQLQEYLQSRSRYTVPPIAYVFEDDPNTLPGTPMRFRCFVTIPGIPQSFPPGPLGSEEGDEILSFPRKDLAKKYAAKCALTYLTGRYREARTEAATRAAAVSTSTTAPQASTAAQTSAASTSLTPSITSTFELHGGDGAQGQKEQQRPTKLQRTQSPTPISMNSTSTKIPGLSIPQAQPPQGSSSSRSNSNKREETYIAKLANLCAEMGVESPKYIIAPSSTGRTAAGELFNGHPVFKTATLVLPEGLGHVQDVLGQKEAKERIAKILFEYIDADHKKHLEKVREIMSK